MPLREILIANRHPRLRLDRRAVARVIHTLDAHFFPTGPGKSKIEIRTSKMSPPSGELSVVFLTDTALAQLHADFLADPTPTDVITFAGDPAQGTAGEICVSADAARRQSRALLARRSSATRSEGGSASRLSGSAFRLSPSAFSAELTLYLVHGWLHLAGYDDLEPAKKRRMRRAETRAMQLLRSVGAIPRFTLRRVRG